MRKNRVYESLTEESKKALEEILGTTSTISFSEINKLKEKILPGNSNFVEPSVAYHIESSTEYTVSKSKKRKSSDYIDLWDVELKEDSKLNTTNKFSTGASAIFDGSCPNMESEYNDDF